MSRALGFKHLQTGVAYVIGLNSHSSTFPDRVFRRPNCWIGH